MNSASSVIVAVVLIAALVRRCAAAPRQQRSRGGVAVRRTSAATPLAGMRGRRPPRRPVVSPCVGLAWPNRTGESCMPTPRAPRTR